MAKDKMTQVDYGDGIDPKEQAWGDEGRGSLLAEDHGGRSGERRRVEGVRGEESETLRGGACANPPADAARTNLTAARFGFFPPLPGRHTAPTLPLLSVSAVAPAASADDEPGQRTRAVPTRDQARAPAQC